MVIFKARHGKGSLLSDRCFICRLWRVQHLSIYKKCISTQFLLFTKSKKLRHIKEMTQRHFMYLEIFSEFLWSTLLVLSELQKQGLLQNVSKKATTLTSESTFRMKDFNLCLSMSGFPFLKCTNNHTKRSWSLRQS